MRVTPMTRTFALVLVGALTFVGCNFEVSNPGPVQDPNVNLPGAHASLVNGAVRSVQNAIGNQYVGENIVHTITPSGHTGEGGTTVEEEMAIITDENNGDNGTFSDAQQGRWVAEEAIRRFTSGEAGVTDPNSYPLLARAYLWAGLANRVLGENMCTAVRDGGAPEDKLKEVERLSFEGCPGINTLREPVPVETRLTVTRTPSEQAA